MPSQSKLIKQGIYLTDNVFDEIIQRVEKGVKASDTLEHFLSKYKEYTNGNGENNPLVINGYKEKMLDIILKETNNHKFSRPSQKELVRVTIENRVGDLIVDVGDDIKNSVRDIIKEGYNNNLSQDEIAENISHRVNVIKNTRARVIARTEIARTATASDYVINKERGATHFTVDCRDTCCGICARDYNWGKIEYTIDQVEMLPPRHPNCRCVAYFYKVQHPIDSKLKNADILNSSKVPSRFISDNTIIPELMNEDLIYELESFEIFTRGIDIENAEIFDANGKSLSEIIIGDEGRVNISWQEVREYVKMGALVLIHNHSENYDNVHSPADLLIQLKSGLKYSIVVSHTKIFIVKNTNEVLTDDDSLIKNIVKFNDDFYGKIDRFTEEKLSMYDGMELDFWETEKLRKVIRDKLLEEHVQEYEEGMSKFFEEGTGLTLYVHDK